MTAEGMTPEEALEDLARLASEHMGNGHDYEYAVLAVLATLDALAALLDPAEMLAAWERAGKARPKWEVFTTVDESDGEEWRGLRQSPTLWELLPQSKEAT